LLIVGAQEQRLNALSQHLPEKMNTEKFIEILQGDDYRVKAIASEAINLFQGCQNTIVMMDEQNYSLRFGCIARPGRHAMFKYLLR
jgi:hypothetical protein